MVELEDAGRGGETLWVEGLGVEEGPKGGLCQKGEDLACAHRRTRAGLDDSLDAGTLL